MQDNPKTAINSIKKTGTPEVPVLIKQFKLLNLLVNVTALLPETDY
jgi:hypothetical protein